MNTLWIKRIAALVGFCCIAGTMLWYADAVLTEKNSTVWGIYEEPKDSLDVIFVGGSHSNAALSPLQMYTEQGFTSFVMYSWSQPIWTSYHYLLETLKTQSPKVVVLDSFGLVYGNTYISDTDINNVSNQFSLKIAPSWNRLQLMLAMSRCQTDHRAFYRYSSLLMYHGRWKNLTAEDFVWPFVSHESLNKGFGPIYTTEPFEQQLPPENIVEQQGYQPAEEYLYRFIELSKQEGFSLVLMNIPYIMNETEYAIYARAARICRENGVAVVDYTDPALAAEIGFDYSTDMAEHAHVNYRGAKKITSHMGSYLKENYSLPDQRQQPEFARWQQLAEIEQRDMQDGALKMEADLSILLEMAKQPEYLFVLQTQGDLTAADSTEMQQAFAAHGLPQEIFADATANALYVYDGGELIFNELSNGSELSFSLDGFGENGQNSLQATSSGQKAECWLNGEQISRDRPGLNLVILDRKSGELVLSVSFSTLHNYTRYTA